jgi:hypothetical protein
MFPTVVTIPRSLSLLYDSQMAICSFEKVSGRSLWRVGPELIVMGMIIMHSQDICGRYPSNYKGVLQEWWSTGNYKPGRCRHWMENGNQHKGQFSTRNWASLHACRIKHACRTRQSNGNCWSSKYIGSHTSVLLIADVIYRLVVAKPLFWKEWVSQSCSISCNIYWCATTAATWASLLRQWWNPRHRGSELLPSKAIHPELISEGKCNLWSTIWVQSLLGWSAQSCPHGRPGNLTGWWPNRSKFSTQYCHCQDGSWAGLFHRSGQRVSLYPGVKSVSWIIPN